MAITSITYWSFWLVFKRKKIIEDKMLSAHARSSIIVNRLVV